MLQECQKERKLKLRLLVGSCMHTETHARLGIFSPLAPSVPMNNICVALEKAMAPHSSTLAWRIPWRRSLVGCSPWGHEELDTTERLPFHFSLSRIGEGNGNPLQCSCLENPGDGGARWAAVYEVAQSGTRLKRFSSSSSSSSSPQASTSELGEIVEKVQDSKNQVKEKGESRVTLTPAGVVIHPRVQMLCLPSWFNFHEKNIIQVECILLGI